MNSVYALVCGSNYSGGWTVYQSQQDAVRFTQYLANIGVPNINVMVLLDNQYTRKTVMRELHYLSKVLKSGDTAILYFAGHGTQVKDNDYRPINGKHGKIPVKDEVDGYDEALQTHDHQIITDDELSYEFAVLGDDHKEDPDWKVRVITVADTCHSPSLDMWRFEDLPVEVISIKAALDAQSALQSGDGSYMSYFLFQILEKNRDITVKELQEQLSTNMREGFAGTLQSSKIEVSNPNLWETKLLP